MNEVILLIPRLIQKELSCAVFHRLLLKLIMREKEEIYEMIRSEFPKMETQDDLLALLNKVNHALFDSEDIKSRDILKKTLYYYKNINLSGEKRYTSFQIPKKNGQKRTISAPAMGLKLIQTCLNEVFQAYYEPNKHVCGFVSGKSIVDGAKIHVGRLYVLNIDLKDFFDSIEIHRIKAMLTCNPFNLKDDKEAGCNLAFTIANLCCNPKEVIRINENGEEEKVVRSVLPQGAPTSPVLTNLVCRTLDRRLAKLSKQYKARYSRYADDITFSANYNIFKTDSDFMKELTRTITEQHFNINPEKTRVQHREGYRQEVTGLVVNEKVNVTKRYVKQIRQWLYYWEHYGYDKAQVLFVKSYLKDKGNTVKGTPHIENVLAGKLDYMKMVKGENDSTYIKLRERFIKLTSDINISEILDVWEKEGIEVAYTKYVEKVNNSRYGNKL